MFTAAHERIESIDPRVMSRPELADLLGEYDRLIARAEAGRLACLAAIDGLGDRGADAATMGRSTSRRSERRAKQDAKVASTLTEMPAVAERLASGAITTEHAALCAVAAERTSTEQADGLADLAAAMPADRFAKKSREWANQREAREAIEARHRAQVRRRSARHWTSGDGMVHLHAEFDAITGASVVASLRERIDQLWHDDGGRDGSPDEQRTHEQRAADALAELLRAEPSARPGPRHPKHTVHLIHRLDTGTTELTDGTPVPAATLAEIGPEAAVVGHVFDTDGRPLWLGRTSRLASRDQWLALVARDRGCADCGTAVDRCEAHHPTEWVNGGATDIDNLQLLCHACHGEAHRGDRVVRRHPSAWKTRRPNSRVA